MKYLSLKNKSIGLNGEYLYIYYREVLGMVRVKIVLLIYQIKFVGFVKIF